MVKILIVLMVAITACSDQAKLEPHKPIITPKPKTYPHTEWSGETSDPQHLCWDKVMTVDGYHTSICDVTMLDDGKYVRNDQLFLYDSTKIEN